MKLWLDDQKDPEILAPMFELDARGWTWVTTIEEAQAEIRAARERGEIIDQLALDYQLGYGRCGIELARWLVEEYRAGKVGVPTAIIPISSLSAYNDALREALSELA